MNTNMIGLRWFLKLLHFSAVDESSLSIERVKMCAPYSVLELSVFPCLLDPQDASVGKCPQDVI